MDFKLSLGWRCYAALIFSGLWDAGVTAFSMWYLGLPEGNPLARVWLEWTHPVYGLFLGKAVMISMVLLWDYWVTGMEESDDIIGIGRYGLYILSVIWFLAGSLWLLFY